MQNKVDHINRKVLTVNARVMFEDQQIQYCIAKDVQMVRFRRKQERAGMIFTVLI